LLVHLNGIIASSILTICSLRCIQLIAGVLGRAGEIGQKKRKEAAERGQIEWESPEYLLELIGRDRKEAQEAQKVEL
jgi:small subunit ribosomal protein S2